VWQQLLVLFAEAMNAVPLVVAQRSLTSLWERALPVGELVALDIQYN
jgi:hypothetical protein